jgi:hypothetical protein
MILNSNKEMFIKAYEMISNSYSYNDFKNPYTIGLAPKNIEEDISMNNLIKISVEALMKKFHNTNIIIPLTEEQIYDTIVEYIEDLGILTDFTIWYSTEGD